MRLAEARAGLIVSLVSALAVAALAVPALAGAGGSQPLIFLSTQLRPIEEAQKMRDTVLRGYVGAVEFIPVEPVPFVDRVLAEQRAGRFSIGVLGGVHGDFPALAEAGALDSLDDVLAALKSRGFPESFLKLGRLGTDHQRYIPWMQATYIMVANRQALPYLPDGASLSSLTYDQLRQWGQNLYEATGRRLLGFPAGPTGLMHRFFQGYLYPSYTASVVTEFRSAQAEAMWEAFRQLWAYVNPQSTSYAFMQEPLLAGEVWVAWDHTARLIDALRQRPDDFVAFPAPVGPAGRGFMPVLAGLAIPKGAPDRAAAVSLIDYLTRPETQVTLLQEIGGFFPVVEASLGSSLPAGVRMAAEAVSAQAASPEAVPSLLPVGLGTLDGEFNRVYLDTFTRIVLRNQPVRPVLDQQAEALRRIMQQSGAPCWPPDQPSDGACPVR